MIAQALPKTQELEEKINLLGYKRRKPSDFDIRLLEKELDKLKNKIDYADYYDFLGRIAVLENNKNNLISNYENAIKLAPNNYKIKYNYATSLRNHGYLSLSVELARELLTTYLDDLKLLEHLIYCVYGLGRFRETLPLLNGLEERSVFKIRELILKAIYIFENAGLTDDEAQQLCELAYSVLETKNLYYSGSAIEIIEDCVFYSIYIDVSIEEAARIDFELSYLFAEKLENMRDDVIVFEYKSVETLKL